MNMRRTAILSAAMMAFALPGVMGEASRALAAEQARAAPALTVTYYYIPG